MPRKEYSKELKSLIRKKFRAALGRFFRKYKKGEEDIPRALILIKEYQHQRAKKNEELNKLREEQAFGVLM
jgi:hypothetical protein